MSTTSSLKKQLTLEDKRKLMLADLEVELKKYSSDAKMAWWCMRLEDKINELNGGYNG